MLIHYIKNSLAVIGGGTVYVGATHYSLLITERGRQLSIQNEHMRIKILDNGCWVLNRDAMKRKLGTIGEEGKFKYWLDELKLPWYHREKIFCGVFIIASVPFSAIQLVNSKRINAKLREILSEQDSEYVTALRKKNPYP